MCSSDLNMILVLTFKDKLDQVRSDIDTEALSKYLGFPVLLISSQDKTNIVKLQKLISTTCSNANEVASYPTIHLKEYQGLVNSLVDDLDNIIIIHTQNILDTITPRWAVLSMLMNPRSSDSFWPFWMVNKVQTFLSTEQIKEKKISMDLVSHFYDIIDDMISSTLNENALKHNFSPYTDKIDKILLNPKLGFPIFMLLMWLVLKITFDISTPISDGLESIFQSFAKGTKGKIGNEL